jgi:hypothetical protein
MTHTTADLDAMLTCGSRAGGGSAHPAEVDAQFARTVARLISDNFDPMPPSTVDGPHVAKAGTPAARYFGIGSRYGVIDHCPGADRPVRTLVVVEVNWEHYRRVTNPFRVETPAC